MADYAINSKSLKRSLKNERHLELIQFNCNGISKKLTEIKVFLYTNKPDIFCLCETWLKKREPKFIGYNTLWTNRTDAGKGGLAILIREDISYKEKQINFFDGGGLELQGIEIKYGGEVIDMLNCYNPNKNITFEEFKFYIAQLSHSFIMVGDYNAHYPTWDKRGRVNYTGRSINRALNTLNIGILNDLDTPTYIDKRTGTTSCLDLCLASHNLVVVGNCDRGSDLGSDHFPIKCSFGVRVNKSNLQVPKRWKTKEAKWEMFSAQLEQSKEHNMEPTNVTASSRDLTDKIIKAAEESIPISSGTRSYNFYTPWWDIECSRAVAERKKAKGKLWRSPSVENLINYKRTEAIAKRVKLKKQQQSWTVSRIHECQHNHQRDMEQN